MQLQNRVVILTGASQGIGQATAWQLAEAGCKVVLVARNHTLLHQLAIQLNSHNYQTVAIPTDITDRVQLNRLVQQTVELFGTVDILINNAGVGIYDKVATMNEAEARYIMEVNYFAPLRLIQTVVPIMAVNPEGGVILNISSIVGRRALPTIGGYCATKGALERLAESLRVELKPTNIRVSTLYPGVTDTSFVDNSLGSGTGIRSGRLRGVSVERVAKRIVTTLKTEPRDVFITLSDQIALWLCAIFPTLADRALFYLFKQRNAL